MRNLRTHTLILWAVVAAAGCATASSGNSNNPPDARPIQGNPDAPIPGRPDAPTSNTPDAPISNTPDAQPQPVTMTETASNTIVVGNAVSCNQANTFYTDENHYYRAFRPSDYGVTGALHVSTIVFGVESATAGSGSGSQPVTVILYTYSGTVGGTTLDTGQMTMIGSTSADVPDTSSGEMVTANLTGTVPAGSSLVAEVYVADGTAAGNILFMGTNTGSETVPGYIMAPAAGCDVTVPTSFASLGLSTQNTLVLYVTGTYTP